MNLFKRNKPTNHPAKQSDLAELALRNICDGVIITDANGVVVFINPAAAEMTGVGKVSQALGLDYGLVLRLESKEGRELSENENPIIQAMKRAENLEKFQGLLEVGQSDKRIPVAVSVLVVDGTNRIITFRNIEKELEEEGEQAEFVSTASHEMRTPVATIDGYISLTLNPQTATIDDRARGYLESAQKASKHLGKLFQDLLDVTKFDDQRDKVHLVPVDMTELIKNIAADYSERAVEAQISYTFGATDLPNFNDIHQISQVVYSFVDLDYMREIMDNLIENALKYTPTGGSVYINVRGDGDNVLVNVTDTGIGISSEDLVHIFQKFYRADNSDTRTIGGTGLGLYMVKQRVEAMGGRVWAESAFGEGSTFYVSLPRLTSDEYEKRMIAVKNQQIKEQIEQQDAAKQTETNNTTTDTTSRKIVDTSTNTSTTPPTVPSATNVDTSTNSTTTAPIATPVSTSVSTDKIVDTSTISEAPLRPSVAAPPGSPPTAPPEPQTPNNPPEPQNINPNQNGESK